MLKCAATQPARRRAALCRACRLGDDVHCENNAFPGIDTNGGYAEYLRTSARSCVKLDDSLEPADVAALADAGLTAQHAAALVVFDDAQAFFNANTLQDVAALESFVPGR